MKAIRTSQIDSKPSKDKTKANILTGNFNASNRDLQAQTILYYVDFTGKSLTARITVNNKG